MMIPYGSVSRTMTRRASSTEGTCERGGGAGARGQGADRRHAHSSSAEQASAAHVAARPPPQPHLRAKGRSPLGHSGSLAADGPRASQRHSPGCLLATWRSASGLCDFEGHPGRQCSAVEHLLAVPVLLAARSPVAPVMPPEQPLRARRSCEAPRRRQLATATSRPVRQSLPSERPLRPSSTARASQRGGPPRKTGLL